jgi:CHAT domain-containing protein
MASADTVATIQGKVATADRHLAAGELREALASLEQAQAELQPDAPAAARSLVLGRLGGVLGEAGEDERAAALLVQAVELAGTAGDAGLQASALNDLGTVQLRTDPAAALGAYDQSAGLADQAGLPSLQVRALANAARGHTLAGDPAAATDRLARATRLLDALPPDRPDVLARLAVAAQAIELARRDPPAYLELAYRLQRSAQQASAAGGSRRDLSWAAGLRGELYAVAGRDDEALVLFRQAALDAEQAGAPELLFRWQWLAGRILAAQGRRDEAITAYRSAARNLELVRLDLPAFDARTGRSLFRETLGPVFTELADLLLQQADGADGQARQADLVEARATIEQLKTVELEDYFKDDCAADLTSRVRPLDQPGERTAVLYPVLLADRTELILSLPDGRLVSARSSATAEEVTAAAQRLRGLLETPDQPGWLRQSLYLYDQLIRPVEPLLAGAEVQTLVFVPDGALRSIPIAALHDGTYFVAERWAVATSLGLNLLDTRPLAEGDVNVLVGGLTQSVQGFAPLPGVKDEIEALAKVLGPKRVLVDQDFVRPELGAALGRTPFNVIHIASHGQFAANPKDSFILTWDGQLDMDQLAELVGLSRFRDQPVEILTLSACQTAAGDDRSALGLAGLAVKVGARSALAALWEVNDASTSALMPRFYASLLEPGVNKAEALRRAQRTLMADKATVHPYYWAAFLLIGNWR